jgi:hypothetical protein
MNDNPWTLYMVPHQDSYWLGVVWHNNRGQWFSALAVSPPIIPEGVC